MSQCSKSKSNVSSIHGRHGYPQNQTKPFPPIPFIIPNANSQYLVYHPSLQPSSRIPQLPGHQPTSLLLLPLNNLIELRLIQRLQIRSTKQTGTRHSPMTNEINRLLPLILDRLTTLTCLLERQGWCVSLELGGDCGDLVVVEDFGFDFGFSEAFGLESRLWGG